MKRFIVKFIFGITLLFTSLNCFSQYVVDTTISDVPWRILYSDGSTLYGTVNSGVGKFRISTISGGIVTPVSTQIRVNGNGIVGISKYSGNLAAVCTNNPSSTEYNTAQFHPTAGWIIIPSIIPFANYDNVYGYGDQLIVGTSNNLTIKNNINGTAVHTTFVDMSQQTQPLSSVVTSKYLFANDTLWIANLNGLLYYDESNNVIRQAYPEICTAVQSDGLGNIYSFHQNGQVYKVKRNGVVVNTVTSIVSSAVYVKGMIYLRCNGESTLLVLDPATNIISDTGVPIYSPWSALFACQDKVWYSSITTKTFSISVPDYLPTTDLGNLLSICQGESISVPMIQNKSTVVTYTDNGQWISITDSILTPTVPGPIKITTSNLYGHSPDTVEIMVNPIPSIGITEGNVCQGLPYVFNFPSLSCVPSQIVIPGSYQVNVINTVTGCTNTIPFTVTNPSYPTNAPQHFCMGDALAVAGVYFKVNGSNVTSVNQGGIYTAYSNVGNCEVADFEVVAVNPTIAYTVGILSAQYSSATLPQQLQWMNGVQDIPFATGLQYTPILNGSYKLRSENDGCTEYSNTVVVSNMSVEEENLVTNIKIYQTGTGLKITLQETGTIEVYDINGKQLYENSSQNHLLELPSGIYIVGHDGRFYKVVCAH